jgi:hypothetical protein
LPLHESLKPIAERIREHFEAPGKDAPYLLYVYPPNEEFQVRKDLRELNLWLSSQGIRGLSISLADIFWETLRESGYLEQLFEEERAAAGNPDALEQLLTSVGEILRQPPSFPERVIKALQGHGDETAAFLYRAGALYPAYRTSALLEELRSHVDLPVTLLYPGQLVGEYGLRFMGKCDPAYGYRATIFSRG